MTNSEIVKFIINLGYDIVKIDQCGDRFYICDITVDSYKNVVHVSSNHGWEWLQINTWGDLNDKLVYIKINNNTFQRLEWIYNNNLWKILYRGTII